MSGTRRQTTPPDTIYFDGTCGLCHRWVKFVIPRDRNGNKFRFAPLKGPTFAERVEETVRGTLPDSVVVQRQGTSGNDGEGGELLIRSAAVLHILRRLGGVWQVMAWIGGIVPRPLRDWAYDRVALMRHRLFRRSDEACPLMSPELRGRFLP